MSNVLVAIEDAYFGELIADFVVQHHWSEGTKLRVLTVIPWLPPETQTRESKDLQDFVEATRKARRELVDNFVNSLKERDGCANLIIEKEILQGNAAELILKVAEAWPAELVLVGSHSRKGLDLFLMGSVSSAIVHHAPCSVVVVRPQQVPHAMAEGKREIAHSA